MKNRKQNPQLKANPVFFPIVDGIIFNNTMTTMYIIIHESKYFITHQHDYIRFRTHSQNRAVPARMVAKMKAFGHLS